MSERSTSELCPPPAIVCLHGPDSVSACVRETNRPCGTLLIDHTVYSVDHTVHSIDRIIHSIDRIVHKHEISYYMLKLS